MPSILQARCDNCDYEAPPFPHGGSAILLDDESESTFACNDDRRIVRLSHPGESRALTQLGYTYTSATLSGRMLAINAQVCHECGQVFESRRLTAAPGAGCAGNLLLGAAIGVAVGVQPTRIGAALIVGAMVAVVGQLVAEFAICRAVRWRYAERARSLDSSSVCPSCDGDVVSTPSTA
jgi:predicted Zn-ribbon and HTH transcriptional regulator